MGPKVEAACGFAQAAGRLAAIGGLDDAAGLLEGTARTRVRLAGRG
jgi:carbamate kinase